MSGLPLRRALLAAPDYVSSWHRPAPGVAKLDHNEAATDVDPGLRAAVLERLAADSWRRYPDPDAAGVRTAVAAAWALDPRAIVVGNGSNALIGLLAGALDPATTVVQCPPDYPVHSRAIAIQGLATRQVPVAAIDALQPFALDLPALHACVCRLALPVVLLSNPGNPTGALHAAEPLLELAALLRERGGLLVLDEAYAEYAGASLVAATAQEPALVVLRTLSKAYGVAGVRIGLLVAHPATAAVFARASLPYSVGLLAQLVAQVVFERGDPALVVGTGAARTATTCAERDRLASRLAAVGGVRVLPSAANFLLVHVDGGAANVLAHLRNRAVVVRDVGREPGLQGCLRIGVGTPAENDRVVLAFEHAR
ncbi:MAG: histidinol-phosphate aminotransferase family protein [Myxococcales bacterium]|nr:histidinol-phosphate aminotransferase family protein [Myxococcales bacterium]